MLKVQCDNLFNTDHIKPKKRCTYKNDKQYVGVSRLMLGASSKNNVGVGYNIREKEIFHIGPRVRPD